MRWDVEKKKYLSAIHHIFLYTILAFSGRATLSIAIQAANGAQRAVDRHCVLIQASMVSLDTLWIDISTMLMETAPPAAYEHEDREQRKDWDNQERFVDPRWPLCGDVCIQRRVVYP